ncbi:MAG: SGNH/GDSL hydrolase family protein [Roseomonas mucosa]|nr:SGNH/GDSL hydrolase family protein [Roseomonas mucosa]
MARLAGTGVSAPLVTPDDRDTHPTHLAKYGQGGYRSAKTLAERDAIPAERREDGMVVRVTADPIAANNRPWKLLGDLVTWEDDSNNTQLAAAEAQAAADAAALAEQKRADAAAAAAQAALDAATANAQRAAAELARALAEAAQANAAQVVGYAAGDTSRIDPVWTVRSKRFGQVLVSLRRNGTFKVPWVQFAPRTQGLGNAWRLRIGGHVIASISKARGFVVRGFQVLPSGNATFDGKVTSGGADPTADADLATKKYVDSRAGSVGTDLLKLDGSRSMTGPLKAQGGTLKQGTDGQGWKDAFGHTFARLNKAGFRHAGGLFSTDGYLYPKVGVRLPSLVPANGLDAAPKAYVDSVAASGGGGGSADASWPVKAAIQMADRCGWSSLAPYSNTSGYTNFMDRMPHNASKEADWTDLVIRMGNFGQAVTDDGPNLYTVRMALEYPAGTYHPIFWPGFGMDLTVVPGACYDSIPLPISLPAGERFWLRRYVTVPSGGTWATAPEMYQIAEGGGVEYGQGTDKTTSGTIAASYGVANLLPLAIVGRPSARKAVVGTPRATLAVASVHIIGDSISEGAGDTYGDGKNSYVGWMPKGLVAAGMGYARTSRSGNQYINFITQLLARRRLTASLGCEYVFSNFGTNDFNAGQTLDQVKTRATTMNSLCAMAGKKLVLATLTPRTNAANDGGYYGSDTDTLLQRVDDFNTWVLSKPFGRTNFDARKYAQDPANPRRWRTDLGAPAADGLHPNKVIHDAIAAGLAADAPSIFI